MFVPEEFEFLMAYCRMNAPPPAISYGPLSSGKIEVFDDKMIGRQIKMGIYLEEESLP